MLRRRRSRRWRPRYAAATLCCSTSAPGDDALRREVCAPEFVHTFPEPRHEHGRAGAGPGCRASGATSSPAARFRRRAGGRRSVRALGQEVRRPRGGAPSISSPATDPRARPEQSDAAHGAQPRLRRGLVADDAFDFARQVPYRTQRPRPVVGSIDLEPVAALDLGAQRRPAGAGALSPAPAAATWRRIGRRGSRSR